MSDPNLIWLRLDNAAKIFPAARRRNWNNVFRLSAGLTQPVDPLVLQQALDVTVRRFPSIAVKLRRGVFWYYLEQLPQAPAVREDSAWPLVRMPMREIRRCAFRVLYYRNRIAVEFFHALTDGSGGLVFLKTLLAEYLLLRYGARIPAENGVLSRSEAPRQQELEDCFLQYAGQRPLSRREPDVYRLRGTPEPDGFLHLTTGTLDAGALHHLARQYGVTVTSLLSGVMLQAVLEMQALRQPRRRQRPVKVTLPVNLRKVFGCQTLRNFALCINVGVDPRLGDESLQALCSIVQQQIALEVTPNRMAARIAANVGPERLLPMRLTPLFLKNFVMKLVYNRLGESKGCLNISNLGLVTLPEEMTPYVERLDFIIGPQATYPNNCSVVTCGGKTRINMIRSIEESELERRFFTKLVNLGLTVEMESNQR